MAKSRRKRKKTKSKPSSPTTPTNTPQDRTKDITPVGLFQGEAFQAGEEEEEIEFPSPATQAQDSEHENSSEESEASENSTATMTQTQTPPKPQQKIIGGQWILIKYDGDQEWIPLMGNDNKDPSQLFLIAQRRYYKEQLRPTMHMLNFKQEQLKDFETGKQFELDSTLIKFNPFLEGVI
jgi:hypothetical protein